MPSTGYGPLRALGETQLQIQFALLGTYDARAIGALAVDSALAAVGVAAADVVGRYWWLSLLGLLIAAILCVIALGFGAEPAAFKVENLLRAASTVGPDSIDRLLVVGLGRAITANEGLLRNKQLLVSVSTLPTGITIVSVIVVLLVG
jgi:hypothetical protein